MDLQLIIIAFQVVRGLPPAVNWLKQLRTSALLFTPITIHIVSTGLKVGFNLTALQSSYTNLMVWCNIGNIPSISTICQQYLTRGRNSDAGRINEFYGHT